MLTYLFLPFVPIPPPLQESCESFSTCHGVPSILFPTNIRQALLYIFKQIQTFQKYHQIQKHALSLSTAHDDDEPPPLQRPGEDLFSAHPNTPLLPGTDLLDQITASTAPFPPKGFAVPKEFARVLLVAAQALETLFWTTVKSACESKIKGKSSGRPWLSVRKNAMLLRVANTLHGLIRGMDLRILGASSFERRYSRIRVLRNRSLLQQLHRRNILKVLLRHLSGVGKKKVDPSIKASALAQADAISLQVLHEYDRSYSLHFFSLVIVVEGSFKKFP